MPVSLSLTAFPGFRPGYFLCAFSMVFLFRVSPGFAQIYFGLPAETVKEKAEKSGFEFAYAAGAANDSSTLVFRKKTDQENQLVCYLNPLGMCYQFGYRVPQKTVPTVIQNLNKQLVKRQSEVWENREKTFLVTLINLPAYTTIMYSPWKPAQ